MNFKSLRSAVLSTLFFASAAGLSFAQEQGLPLPAEQQKRRALDPLEQKEEARKAELRRIQAELTQKQKQAERKKRELQRLLEQDAQQDRKPITKPGRKPRNENKPITRPNKPNEQSQEQGSFQQLRDLGSRLGEQILTSFNERMPVDTAEARERTAQIAQAAWEGLQQRAEELRQQESQNTSNTQQAGADSLQKPQKPQKPQASEQKPQKPQASQQKPLSIKQQALAEQKKAQDKQQEVPSLAEVQRLASRIGRSVWREVMARVDDATPGMTLAEARRRGERMAHGLGRKLSLLARWGQVNGVVEVDGQPVKLSVDRDGNALVSGPQGTRRVQLDEEQMRQLQDALVRSGPGRGEGFGVQVGEERRSADGEALQSTLQGIAQAALTPAQQQTSRRGGRGASSGGRSSLPASAQREQQDFGQRHGARQRLDSTKKKK